MKAFFPIATFLVLASPTLAEMPSLEQAFHSMYNLRFAEARTEIAAYQKVKKDDPLAPVAEASALLFAEFARLRILQTEFFAHDERFDALQKQTPDPRLRSDFDDALDAAEKRARALLGKDPGNKDALFAMSLLNGLRADYAALIEKRNLAALGYTKTATEYAEKVLAIAPDYNDAYLSTGLGKFLIGSKPAPVRWILRLGGFKGDVDDGMAELKIAAEHGHYLAPFARLLLAVGYIRQQKPSEAKKLLDGLRDEFPENPLFAEEAAKLEPKR
jgi:tetratricopeptide (TPR) repeat protein